MIGAGNLELVLLLSRAKAALESTGAHWNRHRRHISSVYCKSTWQHSFFGESFPPPPFSRWLAKHGSLVSTTVLLTINCFAIISSFVV